MFLSHSLSLSQRIHLLLSDLSEHVSASWWVQFGPVWLVLVLLQCWHVGVRKWPPSHPEYLHSTPPVFLFSPVTQHKECSRFLPHWGKSEINASSLCAQTETPGPCSLFFKPLCRVQCSSHLFILYFLGCVFHQITHDWLLKTHYRPTKPLSVSPDPMKFPRSSKSL